MRYLFLIVVVVGVTSCGKKPSTKSEDTPPPPPVMPSAASNQKTDPVVATTGSQGKKMSDEEAKKKTSELVGYLKSSSALTPDLVSRLSQKTIPLGAQLKSGNQGKYLAIQLVQLLDGDADNPNVWTATCAIISYIGTDGKPAVPVLLNALKRDRAEIRIAAMQALGNLLHPRELGMGPDEKAALPIMLAALKDQRSEVRTAAAQALGTISALPGGEYRQIAEARDVAHALGERFQEVKSRDERIYLLVALMKIGPAAVGVVPIVEKIAAEDPDGDVKKSAINTLNAIRPK